MQKDKHTQAHIHVHKELLLSFGVTSDLLFIQTADVAQLSHIMWLVHSRTHQRRRDDDDFSILQTYSAPGNQRFINSLLYEHCVSIFQDLCFPRGHTASLSCSPLLRICAFQQPKPQIVFQKMIKSDLRFSSVLAMQWFLNLVSFNFILIL